MPLNDKYRPDPHKWVCTCPAFARSRFLTCKHLIQAVQPVPPTFFLQVKRNRTLPFWQHPTLIPLEGNPSVTANSSHATKAADDDDDNEQDPCREASNEDDTENIVDMEATLWECDGGTYRERLVDDITVIWDFCDRLVYQLQFEDRRMLERVETLEREGASLLRLVSAGRDGQTRRGVHHRRRGIQQPAVRRFTEHDPRRKDVDT
jgi:hypothetical protein